LHNTLLDFLPNSDRPPENSVLPPGNLHIFTPLIIIYFVYEKQRNAW